MNNEQQTPSGWYADGQGATRWWNGTAWTEQVAAPAVVSTDSQQTASAARRPLIQRVWIGENPQFDSAWIWVASLIGYLSIPLLFAYDWSGYITETVNENPLVPSGFLVYMALLYVISFALYAVIIVASYKDFKHLTAMGVVQPFHWAFSFVGVIVYLIGRHVVLRKVSRTPGWPLWVYVAGQVVTLIIVSAWTVWLISAAITIAM